MHDRLRGRQRLLEIVGGREVGNRRAVADRDSDAGTGQPYAAFRVHDAVAVKLVHGRLGDNHRVVHVTCLDLLHDDRGRGDGENHFMTALLAEVGGEVLDRGLHGAHAEHTDLGRISHAGERHQHCRDDDGTAARAHCLFSREMPIVARSYARSSRSSTHAARFPGARSAPHRHRADVRRGGVLRLPRYDGEIPQPVHGDAAGGVGALHRRVPVAVPGVESVDASQPDADRRPVLQIARSFLLLGSTCAIFWRCDTCSSTRRSRSYSRRRSSSPRLSGPILGEWVGWRRWTRDLRRLHRRAGGDPSGPCHLPTRGAALARQRRSVYAHLSITTRILARTDSNETTLFYSNIVGAVALVPVLPFVWTTPTDPLVIALMVVSRRDRQLRALSADRGPPPGAGRRALAFHLHPDRLVIALGYLVFGDVPHRWTLVGAAIVVASGLYLLHRERRFRGRSVCPAGGMRGGRARDLRARFRGTVALLPLRD